MHNNAFLDNKPSVPEVLRHLQKRLPPGWQLRLAEKWPERSPDAVLELEAPDGRKANLALEIKRRLDPVAVPILLERLRSCAESHAAPGLGVVCLVAAHYLGGCTR